MANRLPSSLDLPTGLGKTSIIALWLLAFAAQCENGVPSLPRRLIYIVNRRTVVDQATEHAHQIRQRLIDAPTSSLKGLVAALGRWTASDGLPLAISTLRGELADNREWILDPTRPAIVIGTIDMIGSKLLFSGYGDGPYHRSHHAGLIGQDSLIVHDEAHLTPAFDEVLRTVASIQAKDPDPRPLRVLSLSATLRHNTDGFGLTSEDDSDSVVRQRLDAAKRLMIVPVHGRGALLKQVTELALAYEGQPVKVLLYLRQPENVREAARQIRHALGTPGQPQVGVLTGTMRGFEREFLMRESPVLRAFISDTTPERTSYLVSTSAGEVGIDLCADHLICDLTTIDALVQRLGRVNRRGGSTIANVTIVADQPSKLKEGPFDAAISHTLHLLSNWTERHAGSLGVSPRELRELVDGLSQDDRDKARTPSPKLLDLDDIVLDGWSLTSIAELPGRPQPADYLHGIEPQPPETVVAWRQEVSRLHRIANAQADEEDGHKQLEAWFRKLPVRAHERLSDRSDRVRLALTKLLASHCAQGRDDVPVILIDQRGAPRRSTLAELVATEVEDFYYQTVVLPDDAGGLNEDGLLDPDTLQPDKDVAEKPGFSVSLPQRWLRLTTDMTETYRHLRTNSEWPALPEGLRILAHVAPTAAPDGPDLDADGCREELLLAGPPKAAAETDPEQVQTEQTLAEHARLASQWMTRISCCMQLHDRADALITAAAHHDDGKDRLVWQRYANNGTDVPVAKSKRYQHWRTLGGYRHEFGSLVTAAHRTCVQEHPDRELILQLIAAHHGWGRPHFARNAFDSPPTTTAENERMRDEVLGRFGKVQSSFGRWGLAWLESLLRSADMAASGALALRPLDSDDATIHWEVGP